MNRQQIGLVIYVIALVILLWAFLNFLRVSYQEDTLQEAIKQYCELKTGSKSNEGYTILEDGSLQINCGLQNLETQSTTIPIPKPT